MSINTDIMLILNSHMDYLGRIDDYMSGKIPDPMASSHDKCKLGSWYYAVSDPAVKSHPEFAPLGEIHQQFHALTDEAISDFRAGNAEAAKEKVSQAFSLFGQISNKLMAIDEA